MFLIIENCNENSRRSDNVKINVIKKYPKTKLTGYKFFFVIISLNSSLTLIVIHKYLKYSSISRRYDLKVEMLNKCFGMFVIKVGK